MLVWCNGRTRSIKTGVLYLYSQLFFPNHPSDQIDFPAPRLSSAASRYHNFFHQPQVSVHGTSPFAFNVFSTQSSSSGPPPPPFPPTFAKWQAQGCRQVMSGRQRSGQRTPSPLTSRMSSSRSWWQRQWAQRTGLIVRFILPLPLPLPLYNSSRDFTPLMMKLLYLSPCLHTYFPFRHLLSLSFLPYLSVP